MIRAGSERFDIRALVTNAKSLADELGVSRKTLTRARQRGAYLRIADLVAAHHDLHVDLLPRWEDA